MTAKKKDQSKRVAVTLSPEGLAMINELSALTGQPKSALLSEMVDTALPAFQTTVQALRVIQEQPREAQRLLANFTAGALRDVSQAQLDLDTAIDARTVKGKRGRRRATPTP